MYVLIWYQNILNVQYISFGIFITYTKSLKFVQGHATSVYIILFLYICYDLGALNNLQGHKDNGNGNRKG